MPEGDVKKRFASCIVERSAVDFRLIIATKTLRSDSGNVPRTLLNFARPSDVHDEFNSDVADPQLCHLITTARPLARSGMSLETSLQASSSLTTTFP
jgi:hypothetical protein